MQAAIKMTHLPELYQMVKLFQVQKCLPLITALWQSNILYKFQTKFIIMKNGITRVIKSMKEGMSMLKSLGVDMFTQPSASKYSGKLKVVSDWSTVKGSTLRVEKLNLT